MKTLFKNQHNSPGDKIADIEKRSLQKGNLLRTEKLPAVHDQPFPRRIQIFEEKYSVDGVAYEEILTEQVVWMSIGEEIAPYIVLSINIDLPQTNGSMRFTAMLKEI